MSTGKILMVILIIGLVFLVGCNSNAYQNPPAAPSGQYVGGGCGVEGIHVPSSVVSNEPVFSGIESF